MQILPNDIIIRNYKDGETIWISQRLVVQVCEVDKEYLETTCRKRFKKSIDKAYKYGDFLPNTGVAWRWARVNGTFYYDFDCLPDRKPTHYRSRFGTKQDILQAYEKLQITKNSQKTELIKAEMKAQVQRMVDNSAITYYMYQNPLAGFNQSQATEMATARAWCMWMKMQLTDDNFKKLGINKVQDFYNLCAEIITPLELEGFKIKSAAYLRNKVNEYPIAGDKVEQLNFFISGKYGNNNAQIVGKATLVDESTGQTYSFDLHEAMMFQLYMNPGGSTKEYIHSLHQYYLEDVKEFGVEPVAYRTFCHHLSRFNNQIKVARARHGKDYYKKNVQTYVAAEKLKYAHSLFAGDGSGTISYKYYKKVKKRGKEVLELTHRKLYVILITDVASRYIAGFSVARQGSSEETPQMTKDAVKMAIENGGKQTMFEFVSDNHGAFTSGETKDFLNLAFNKVRTIEAHNSQANPAETQFRLFKRSLKDIKNFISTSWQVGVEGQNNPDHINTEDLPTYEDAVIQLYELVNRWNTTPLRDGTTPAERFANKNPKCQEIEPVVLRNLFAKHTEVDVSYMRGFVNVYRTSGYEVSEQFQFEIPGHGAEGTEMIAKATGYTTGAKVKVVWDEEFADLYTLDGKYIISCPRVVKASQSHAEMTDEQANALEHHLSRKAKQTAYVDEFEANLSEIANELPYSHAMALGGSKESYNEAKREHEEQTIINKKTKQRVDRDFNASEWSNLNQ